MSRHRYVWRGGRLVELDLDAPLPKPRAPYVISDIAPYRSMITREPITSRSYHREHLRAHSCIELGNEMPRPSREPPSPIENSIKAAMEASPERHAEARATMERATMAAPINRVLP